MSVDILGRSWDRCRSMVQYSFTSTETRRLVRTDSPGRPPRLSRSSWTMCHTFHLNGIYTPGGAAAFRQGVQWLKIRRNVYSLKTTEMKLKPRILIRSWKPHRWLKKTKLRDNIVDEEIIFSMRTDLLWKLKPLINGEKRRKDQWLHENTADDGKTSNKGRSVEDKTLKCSDHTSWKHRRWRQDK